MINGYWTEVMQTDIVQNNNTLLNERRVYVHLEKYTIYFSDEYKQF